MNSSTNGGSRSGSNSSDSLLMATSELQATTSSSTSSVTNINDEESRAVISITSTKNDSAKEPLLSQQGGSDLDDLEANRNRSGANNNQSTLARICTKVVRLLTIKVDLKWLSFCLLVFVATGGTLIGRKSRMTPNKEDLYIPSTSVLMAEVYKLIVCLFGYYYTDYSLPSTTSLSDVPPTSPKQSRKKLSFLKSLKRDVFGGKSDWLAMSLPASLYFIMNYLQLLAFTHLDPATFQITNQFKLVTTAGFTVVWLGRVIGIRRWLALLVIFIGICGVQVDGLGQARAQEEADGRLFGVGCMVLSCLLSGFAGCWFEGALKGKKVSLFLRNIQLSVLSIIPGFFIAVMLWDGALVRQKGFFHGYNIWTWSFILFNGSGGLIVAVVVKYADTILKVIATTLAIIASALASSLFFGVKITGGFCLGSLVVMIGTFSYILDEGQIRSLWQGMLDTFSLNSGGSGVKDGTVLSGVGGDGSLDRKGLSLASLNLWIRKTVSTSSFRILVLVALVCGYLIYLEDATGGGVSGAAGGVVGNVRSS